MRAAGATGAAMPAGLWPRGKPPGKPLTGSREQPDGRSLYFRPLPGVMGVGVPKPVVPVPMLLDPMGVLLPDEPDAPEEPVPPDMPDEAPDEPMPPEVPEEEPDDEPDESAEGVLRGVGKGTVPVSSNFLPQAPKLSRAASAPVTMVAVLKFGLNIQVL